MSYFRSLASASRRPCRKPDTDHRSRRYEQRKVVFSRFIPARRTPDCLRASGTPIAELKVVGALQQSGCMEAIAGRWSSS
jgi:hypothetical protein